ncbi:sodium/calcium exchanger 1 [Necator americanus]|uniref:Sodium/calcium exchanger 1 n=1 Tax=Necator americanus TaxID=51031 RepID=W2T3J8_NECAM|nr:sodium/calcium exchanger 1 [Necator americanus]ETN75557.1 sodium/calcium exchanger 1 [Necator americanus]
MIRLGGWLLTAILVAIQFDTTVATNCSAADATRNCIDGLIVPIWRPFLDLSPGDKIMRGLIYFVVIAYCFLGVSIVADRFMSSIEVITSMERKIVVKRPGLDPMEVHVRIWNDTVSNLTLMALGSSAPEILLSIIENRFLPRRYRRGSHGMIATEGEELKMLESNGITQAYKDFTQGRYFRGPKSRAFYRVQATRRLIGGGDIVKKRIDKEHNKAVDVLVQAQEKQVRENTCKIYFDPAHYTVLENIGNFDVVVGRDGGPEGLTVMVDYYTEDGTANAGSDYIPVKGTLTFYPDDKYQVNKFSRISQDVFQKISIEIVDDDVFEEDEHFYLHLRNLRVRTKDGLILDPSRIGGLPVAQLEMPATATIMILDDDHAGVFSFEHDHFQIVESCGHLSLRVQRSSGARGKVVIPFRTSDGTAIGDKHFESKEGEIVFDDNQTEAFIELGVMDTEQYERSDYFFIELAPPIWAKKMSGTRNFFILRYFFFIDPILEAALALTCRDCADLSKVQERFQRRMEQKRRASIASESKESSEPPGGRSRTPSRDFLTTDPNQRAVSASPNLSSRFKKRMGSWIAGMKDGEGGDEPKEKAPPSCGDYIMHFMTMPWKLLFATIPPTEYWGGWACFVVSIFMIGVLTALVGDLASQFGCWVGLKDSVTAISFVALGTSVPDTFASKVSAVQDKYADNSIGNVTGSNAVNVFLGIGIAWSVAAIYHFFNGTQFLVDPGNLGFSVLVFCLEACACITVIVLRRGKLVGGELGGPLRYRVMTSVFFMSLWLLYLILSALEAYCIVKGF